MHIKHQKTEELGCCGVSQWLKHTVYIVFRFLFCFFFFFFFVVVVRSYVSRGCAGSGREAITAGPRSRAAAQKAQGGRKRRRRFENQCTVPELDTRRGEPSPLWSSRLRLGPGCALPDPPASSPTSSESALAPRSGKRFWVNGRGWRIRRLGCRTWPRWFCFVGGRGESLGVGARCWGMGLTFGGEDEQWQERTLCPYE